MNKRMYKKIVKTLQIETDQVIFRNKLLEFCSLAETSYPNFFYYFKNEFLKRERLWAYCYREATCASTNMALESFHRVLKSVYFNRKRNKRVDNLLSELLKIARDKAFEAWAKFEKGKRTNKIRDIDQRHISSLLIDKNTIVQLSEFEWKCPSQSTDGKQYVIVKGNDGAKCMMKCSSCLVCIHVYSCSCPDYVIHSVPCKHVHAIHMLTTRDSEYDLEEMPTCEETAVRKRSYFHRQIADSDVGDKTVETRKKDIRRLMDLISRRLDSTNDTEIVCAVHSHLKNALSVVSGMVEDMPPLEVRGSFSTNRQFEKQRRFHSTKKKAMPKPKTLNRPSDADKEEIFEILGRHTVNYAVYVWRKMII